MSNMKDCDPCIHLKLKQIVLFWLRPIEISLLVRGVTPACSVYKETILAFYAHSSLLSEQLTTSLFDWGQGKYTCHSKRNIIY